MKCGRRTAALAVVLSTVGGAAAFATTTPAPAPRAEVRQLVANSAHLSRLSAIVQAEIIHAGGDFSWAKFPTRGVVDGFCESVTACVYGDRHASRTIVLFGDSHALMWLPAVAPFASAHHYRLVLAWLGLCSPAKLDLHYVKVGDPKNCNIFRANIVREITSLKPALVLLSGRNTLIPKSRTVFFTNAEWAVGYEQTIHALKTKNTKVAVIEDSVTFDSSVPACLSVHVTSVHRCAVKDPNWFAPALTAGEISATKFEHVAYIKTHPWLCTKWCSPVIGSFIVYSDADHLTFSYTHFLSRVMGADIAAVLK